MPSKKSGSLPLIYWDACCFVYLINDDLERIDVLKPLYENARKGGLHLTTSTVSIVEVSYTVREQAAGSSDESELAKVDALWRCPDAIQLIEFYRETAFEARRLSRELSERNIRGLSNNDCIHLASAKARGVTEIHTYDDKWHPASELVGIDIKEPDTMHIALLP